MTAMLASVRDLGEAQLVAAGGVDWIDLKDPARGALGAVDPAIIAAVVKEFGRRFRLSATVGDCWDSPADIPARVAAVAAAGAAYAKVGAYARQPSLSLLKALRSACSNPVAVIVVCFAEAPPTEADVAQLRDTGIVGIMLDTAVKDGPALRTLMTDTALAAFVSHARSLGLLTGLAGRLGADDVSALLTCGPDYLGFRGALCAGHKRVATVDLAQVRRIRASIPENRLEVPV